FDNPTDGINAWLNRIPMVKSYLHEAKADIVGVQEALHHQVLDLEKMLPDYKRVGTGRDDGREAGEYSPVFFRKDRFELVDNGQFWLSETPEVPGSIGPCAVLPRITTWAQLRIKSTGKNIFVFNTHYCHVNDAARWFGAGVMSEKMAEIAGKMPMIVTGDFNLDTDSETYRKVAELFLKNNHLTNAVKLHLTEDQIADGTFNAFRYTENQPFIDYIFISQHFESKSSSIDKVVSEGIFISDHWPVTLRLKVKPSDEAGE
ncbi:MAG TPA: endonuclease/exonuclease/phosphatase family protein, partial [Bacteroidales bacterium]|nr:endonuclease/exonuclease/phosphatase family protein [Bacteroidales bacterium]